MMLLQIFSILQCIFLINNFNIMIVYIQNIQDNNILLS